MSLLIKPVLFNRIGPRTISTVVSVAEDLFLESDSVALTTFPCYRTVVFAPYTFSFGANFPWPGKEPTFPFTATARTQHRISHTLASIVTTLNNNNRGKKMKKNLRHNMMAVQAFRWYHF
ncbi:hypothetical protein PIB30_067827 [Stylosanthes scabra]|uniref:Uncharacterized protein n=1 Tax=Stylosanthes scabra TaxID=79078 RepID=A0ABU6URD8_9FABA|nr:hypothetical protein [Stylosanthes scabra]